MSFDYNNLVEKLRRVESLYAGATTDGERQAALNAAVRIQQRLAGFQRVDPPIEYKFSMPDPWRRKLFLALVRRYGLRPYRLPRQHYNTVMVKVSRRFVDEVLWPEYLALSEILEAGLEEVTDRIVSEALQSDTSEPK